MEKYTYIDIKAWKIVAPKVLRTFEVHGHQFVVHEHGAKRAGKRLYTAAHRATGFSVLPQSSLPTTVERALALGKVAVESRTKEQVEQAVNKARELNRKAFVTLLAKKGGKP